MKITASYALLLGTVAALLLMLTPGVAKAQSTLSAPTNLTVTPGVGAVYLEWTPPPAAEYHFVAWLPVGADFNDAQIRPLGAMGEATITGLLPQQTYHFTVIAGRWEWSPADFGAKWSGWAPWAAATPLRAALPGASGVDGITSSSTTASARVELVLTIASLPIDLRRRSSIELYLEDDFRVPDAIGPGSVYFAVANPTTAATGGGNLIAVTDLVEINEGNHFRGNDDWAIRVPLPDLNTGDNFDGFQGPAAGQTLQLVILQTAGIRNPSEQGIHSVGYSALGPADAANAGPQATLDTLHTYAKISLSDNANTRGYYLTVTGSGFNNGTSAAVHVLADPAVPQDLAAMVAAGGDMEAEACRLIIREGRRAGIAPVGRDDKVAVEFEVAVPLFTPGNVNYLCMVDGEGRISATDVERFRLQPTIRVSPTSAAVGDTVSIFAQDFPNPGAALSSLRIANQEVFAPTTYPYNYNRINVEAIGIGNDGSATATFAMPGSVSGTPLEGAIGIDATWGNVRANTRITLTGSTLRLNVREARANESIILEGEGFGRIRDNYIDPANITIDRVPLLVDDGSLDRNGRVAVSNAGRFTAIVHLWNATGDQNPALTPGTHIIRAADNHGFYGTTTIVIKDPRLTVTPEIAGPGDYVTIAGADWPLDNYFSDAYLEGVIVAVENREYTVIPDAAGNFTVTHRVRRNAAIPSTQQVRATYGYGYGEGEIVKVTSFEVPPAQVTVTPAEGRPGDTITLRVTNMPPDTAVKEITIAGHNILGDRSLRTDQDGAVSVVATIPDFVPGVLSPTVGYYRVVVNQTVAIGRQVILP